MYLKTAAVAGLVFAAAGVALAPPALAAGAPVSRIYSAAQTTCLDVATTDPSAGFLDTYGHACNGSTTQAFAFHALSTGPAATYEITSQSTGKCLDQYRSGIRQESCTGSVPPDTTNVEWTLQRVGTTGHRYHMLVTTTVGTSSPRCVQVYPTPNGYPGPLFDLTACATNQPAQVLTLNTAP